MKKKKIMALMATLSLSTVLALTSTSSAFAQNHKRGNHNKTTVGTTTNTNTNANTSTNTNTNTNTSSSYEQEVVSLINQERTKAGLSPITLDSKVSQAAQIRASELKTSFSHTRPDGTSFYTALSQVGATYKVAGENVASGYRTPEQVVSAWMSSSGHRSNILNPSFKYMGIGIDGTNWAQIFTY